MPGWELVAITITFLFAGLVKGVIGMGLPTVSLGLMALFLELPSAIALILVPSAVTNLWQACAGGNGRELLRRFWPFFTTAVLFVGFGVPFLRGQDHGWLIALLGALLVVQGAIGMAGYAIKIRTEKERAFGAIVGGFNGVLTGMTGSFTVPGVLYLQSVELDRNRLVQAMGILFFASTIALAGFAYVNNLLNQSLAANSFLTLVPALLGMYLGQQIRQMISENLFRRLFLAALILLGLSLLWTGLA